MKGPQATGPVPLIWQPRPREGCLLEGFSNYGVNAVHGRRVFDGIFFEGAVVFEMVKGHGKEHVPGGTPTSLGVPPPFFPGILLSRKPPETQGKRPVFEKNDN